MLSENQCILNPTKHVFKFVEQNADYSERINAAASRDLLRPLKKLIFQVLLQKQMALYGPNTKKLIPVIQEYEKYMYIFLVAFDHK